MASAATSTVSAQRHCAAYGERPIAVEPPSIGSKSRFIATAPAVRTAESFSCSSQVAYDCRSERVRHASRQAAPERDEVAIAGVQRIVLGNVGPRIQPELVRERLWREAPVLLEVERSGAALAAAVVEDANA